MEFQRRSFLIHVCDAVDMTIVWRTAQDDIAPVLADVERILAEGARG